MSDRPEDVIDVALRVADALESVGARYFVGVVRAQASNLDMDYLRSWAARLAVNDLLDRAVAEISHD